jgi:hypothetical protein
MSAMNPLRRVRLRLSCADVLEYDERRADDIQRNGVFIPSARGCTVGERVQLDIELLDGSRAYHGLAVVTGEIEESSRVGYMLALETAAGGGSATSAPVLQAIPVISLAESLFGDSPVHAGVEGRLQAARNPMQETPGSKERVVEEVARSFVSPTSTRTAMGAPGAKPGPTLHRDSVVGLARASSARHTEDEPELIRLPPPEPDDQR